MATVAKMINPLLGEHITVKYNFGANLPVLYSDPGLLQQIMINLSVNLRDAMPEGGQPAGTTTVRSATT